MNSTDLKLSDELRLLLTTKIDGKLTIGHLFDKMGDRGFGLALLLTSLPSALPIPAPGYSTPFGLLLMLLALQILAGRKTPWLPRAFYNRTIPDKLAHLMTNGAQAFFSRVEHLIHPRWMGLTRGPGRIIVGILVFLMAALMALPIPGTNTAPAGVIFLLGVALTEEDGLLVGLGMLLGGAACALYGAILFVIFYYGANGVSEALHVLRQWIL